MSFTADQLNAALDVAYPGRNWTGKCEASRFQSTRLSNGLITMQSYTSAKAAKAASTIGTTNRGDVPVGWVGFWDKTSYGHDMLSFGNDIWFGATGLGDTIKDFGGGLKLLHGSTYPAPFLGAAQHVGPNPQAQLVAWPVNPPAPSGGGSGVGPYGNTNHSSVYQAGPGWEFWVPDAATQKTTQGYLAKRGRYSGPVNGIWVPNTVKGIQLTVSDDHGNTYTGPINGIAGKNTCLAIQRYAAKFGGYTGPVNGLLGANTWRCFNIGLGKGL